MTIIERLKKLAKKLTGKDISGETIQEVLDSFEKAAVSAAKEPSVPTQKPAERSYGYSSRRKSIDKQEKTED